MYGLNEVVEIIKDLRIITSSNAKIHLLSKNKDNDVLKKVLYYCYNSDYQFGIKKTTLEKMDFSQEDSSNKWNNNLWLALEDLAKSNINKQLISEVEKLIRYYPDEEIRSLIKCILLKDMKIGMNIKSINKAINNLIPVFDVMKASSYDEKNSISFNKKANISGYLMMIKENGIRGEIIKENGHIIVKSRQNKVVEGFDELDKAFKNMPDGYLYEGEILSIGEFETSKEQFKETDKIYSKKGKKTGLMIKLFDLVPLNDFYKGEWNVRAVDRKKLLRSFIERNNHSLVQFLNIIYEGTDTSLIQEKLEEVSENGKYEGLMVMLKDGKYEAKRVKQILKCKLFNTVDLRVVGIKESKEKPGTMGSAIVMYKNNPVGVSGWKEEDKVYYYQKPHELIGKIIEIKFKEVTVDKNGVESLQFPNVVRIRLDKDEENYE